MQVQAARRRASASVLAAVLAAGVMLWGTPAQATAPAVSPVITGKGSTILPAATDTYLGWSANSKHHKQHFDLYAKRFGNGRKRINSTKVQAWSGGIVGDQFALQFSTGAFSDIGIFNLAKWKPKKVPSGINTKLWEWSPTIDSDHILFGRNDFRKKNSPWKVLLYDRSSHHITTLDKAPSKCRCLFPGQVQGNYATWTKCVSRTNCNSYYYDISGHQKHALATTSGKIQWYAVPEGSGTFYFVQSGWKCASTTQIMRWAVGDLTPTAVATLPSGFTVWDRLYATTGGGAQAQVYFDRAKCSHPNPDIFVVDNASARVAPSVAAAGRTVNVGRSGSALPVAGPQAGP
jgi:hypothetical protein